MVIKRLTERVIECEVAHNFYQTKKEWQMDKYIEALKLIDKIANAAIEGETIHSNPELLAYMSAISIVAEEAFTHYNIIDD